MASEPRPSPRQPSTEEIASVAFGDAAQDVVRRIEIAATRDRATADLLRGMRTAAEAVRAECTAAQELEPPADALRRALALGARVAARGQRPMGAIASIGSALDTAGAAIASWLGLARGDEAASVTLAGFRDDRGADTVAGTVGALRIRAERIEAEDGTERVVGEIAREEGAGGAMRGSIAALGAGETVLARAELDPFGMFTLAVPAGTARLALIDRAGAVVAVIEWPARSGR
ncbi:MAG: hypothetical protein GC172_08740 [Phycisphaera sp.]|nr:hypothetical protein [Phycisphaera sp.]